MRPIRGGYLSFYNRKGLRGIFFFVMAAPPFTVTVSGILRTFDPDWRSGRRCVLV